MWDLANHSEDWCFPEVDFHIGLWQPQSQKELLWDSVSCWALSPLARDWSMRSDLSLRTMVVLWIIWECYQFHSLWNACNLLSLCFKGPRYTWTHCHHGPKDWVELSLWKSLFPEAVLSHLPRTHSDHCPMLIKLEGLPFLHSLVQAEFPIGSKKDRMRIPTKSKS